MANISVIIPVYNVEAYLPQCLESIIRQTYRKLEIIIIEDGSPDGCGKICDDYADRDKRIHVIHKENAGVDAARDDGIVLATGEWISFVDSDDWLDLDFYEKMIAADDGQGADVIFAGGFYKEYAEKSKKIRIVQNPCCYDDREHIEDIQAQITKYGLPWDKLYRTDFLKKHNFRFEQGVRSFDDFLFNFKVLEKAECVLFSPVIGYHYRQVAVSIANGYNPKKPDFNYEFISKLHDYASQQGTSVKKTDGINAAAICAISVAMNACYYHPANPKKQAEIKEEMDELISRDYFYEAIHSPSNRYLTKRQFVLKYVLRLNRGGVLRVLHMAKQRFMPYLPG